MCKLDAEIKSYKEGKSIEFNLIIIYHVRATENVAAICAVVTIMIAQYTFQ